MLFAAVWLAASIAWPYLFYRAVDPLMRALVTKRVGAPVVWTNDARRFLVTGRYHRWHWGVAGAPSDHVTFAEGMVNAACVVAVNIVAGMILPAVLFLSLGSVGVYAYPLLLLAIPIYAIYWSGKFRPPIG
jgi:hypothetical protein